MNNQQRIGIIGAMQSEVDQLIAHLTRGSIVQKCGMLFCIGSLGKHEVVVVKCGVGKVNAAVCTQILIDEFEVAAVVFSGVAGSLDARIDIGDLVIATDVVYHDLDARGIDSPVGQVPFMDTFAFPIDERLATVARAAAEAEGLKVWRGRIASGDQFVCDQARKDEIVSLFGALCCEMEGAAVAQTCYLNNVPCLIMRAISDKADGSATEDFDTFEAKAAVACANTVERFIAELDRSTSSAAWGLGSENDLL